MAGTKGLELYTIVDSICWSGGTVAEFKFELKFKFKFYAILESISKIFDC